jgi:hypothetical protein
MPTVHPRRVRARATVVTALVALPVLCLAMSLGVDRLYPGWDDYELAVILGRLRDRTAEFPHRPLELVLGSSRAMNAFDTDGMSTIDPDGPVVMNLSLVGSAPLDSLLMLRHVVALGHRPRGVILEVLPIWIRKHGPIGDKGHTRLLRYRAADLPMLSRVTPTWAPRLWHDWAAYNACRWHTLRADLLAEAVPAFAARDRLGQRANRESIITPYGWCPMVIDPVPPETYRKGLEVARTGYQPQLQKVDGMDPVFEAVMEEFFAFCREHQIVVRAVVITPENKDFLAFYGPGVEQRTADLLGELCRRHGARLLDARRWIADHRFLDGHHLNARGSQEFTRQFLHGAW